MLNGLDKGYDGVMRRHAVDRLVGFLFRNKLDGSLGIVVDASSDAVTIRLGPTLEQREVLLSDLGRWALADDLDLWLAMMPRVMLPIDDDEE